MNISPYLKQLGYNQLKEKQKEILRSISLKKDTIGILPTGYGKSVCYILPHLLYKKNVIVISPLIALMEDQYRKLEDKGLNIYTFNSTKNINIRPIINNEEIGILYFSPESFMAYSQFINKLVNNKKVCLFAIDEAHCITSWCDFRNDYNNLYEIKEICQNKIPVLAVTATATNFSINQISEKLNLNNPVIIKSSFVKSNLHIKFFHKNGLNYDISQIINLIKKHNCKTIIYCKTRKETEEISNLIKTYGLTSAYYHGDLKSDVRTRVQEQFTSNQIDIICATIAFGMGIDICNIYLIIHYGISKTIESYYQEIGRAGRDMTDSYCYLFWNENDFRLNKFFVSKVVNEELKEIQYKQIQQVENFIYSNKCRMQYIVNYFNEQCDICNKCDNCKKWSKPIKLPCAIYIYNILSSYIKLQYSCGNTKMLKILFGSEAKEITKEMKKLKTYGIYNTNSTKKDYIKNIMNTLIEQQFLKKVELGGLFGIVYTASDKGKQYYKDNKKKIEKSILTIQRFGKRCIPKCTKKKKSLKSNPSNKGKRWTKEADKLFIKLLSNTSIEDMAKKFSRTPNSIECRIFTLLEKNKLDINKISHLDYFPKKELIKKIKDLKIKLKDDKKIKTELNCSYFDIKIANFIN